GESAHRAAARSQLRPALFQARHRAGENPRLKRWLLPAVAAALFAAVSLLHANAPLFIALNHIGPTTSDALWANITVLGDGWVAALVAVATIVAISRAVVGVHWPLDILAGAFGGWLSAVFAVWLGGRTRRFGEHPAVQAMLALLLAACALALVAGYPDDYPQA